MTTLLLLTTTLSAIALRLAALRFLGPAGPTARPPSLPSVRSLPAL